MNDKEVILDKLADEYRIARLNVVYYGSRLVSLQRQNTALEVIIAIGTSGSVASLALFQTEHGKLIFGLVAATSAVFGVLKPVLGLSKTIERISKLWSGWNAHYYALKSVLDSVSISHQVAPETETEYKAAVARVKQLSAGDDPMPSQKHLKKFYAQVNAEIPPDSLPSLA